MQRIGKIIIHKNANGKYEWRIKARNGRILAISPMEYNTKWGAWKAIKILKDYILNSKVVNA